MAAAGKWTDAFEELARPLHEGLYEAQSFDYMKSLSPLEQLILSLDYIRMQVGQGGFIQLLQNGYAPLLVTAIESAQPLGMVAELQHVLDDALKVFVLNNEALSRETTPEEFAKLYDEFKEFEVLDAAFAEQLPAVTEQVVSSCMG